MPPGRTTYLDWNSTTPILPEVAELVARHMSAAFGNPASTHREGRRARDILEGARESVAQFVGTDSRDVLFTSGGTEANNLALSFPGPLVLSRLEHPSVSKTAEHQEANGRVVSWVPVSPEGRICLDGLERCLHTVDRGAQVALMAANHETGVVQPIEEAIALALRYGARVHVDAVQWAGKGDMGVLAGADSISVAAHKLRGPKGIGALAFRGAPPPGLMRGGAQQRGLRPGTLDAGLAAGFQLALTHAAGWQAGVARLSGLRDALEHGIGRWAQVNGERAERLPHVCNASFTGWPGPELAAALDLAGICVSSGSACSAGTNEPSPVIDAMLGAERARSALRLSLGELTTAEDVATTLQELKRILQ